ncbi:MAG TPA: hypothetical protein VGL93_16605 [Streptosporangiaceae bacterium]|jgi:hypothetical protein
MKKRILLGAVAVGAALVAFTGTAAQAGTAHGGFRTNSECEGNRYFYYTARALPSEPCYFGRDGLWYYTA